MSVKQAVTLVVLLGGAGVVWVPQIAPKFMGESEEVPQPSAEGLTAQEAFDQGLSPFAPGSADAEAGGAQGEARQPASSSGQASMPPSGPAIPVAPSPVPSTGEDMGDLRGLLDSMRSFRPEGLPLVATQQGSDGEFTADMPVPLATSAVLQANPLTAILRSESGSRVVMGGRAIVPGEELAPGMTLDEVDARGVWIDARGNRIWVALPPLRARPATTGGSERDNNPDNDGTETAEGTPGE